MINRQLATSQFQHELVFIEIQSIESARLVIFFKLQFFYRNSIFFQNFAAPWLRSSASVDVSFCPGD